MQVLCFFNLVNICRATARATGLTLTIKVLRRGNMNGRAPLINDNQTNRDYLGCWHGGGEVA